MANPSDVPASAAGTEILRRAYYNALSGATNRKLLDGQADYTYTILTVSFTEMDNVAEELHLWVDIEAGGTEIFLLNRQAIGARETFIYDQKILMAHSDELWIGCVSAANVDVHCTYIEQRWA